MVMTTGAALGAAAIGAAASTANTAISAGLGALQNYRNYKYQKKLTRFQYELERRSRQTSYGDTKQSLLEAGYNPMLALGEQSNALTPGMSFSGQGNPDVNIGADALNAVSALSNVKRNNTLNTVDVQNAENNAIMTLQQGALYKAQADGQLISNEIQQQTGMIKAQAEIEKILADTDLSKQQKSNLIQEIKESGARINNLNANAYSAMQQGHSYSLSNSAEKDYQSYTRRHPNVKNTGYASRAMGFNPVSSVIKGAIGGLLLKGK